MATGARLGRDFYAKECVELAKSLLGQRLVCAAADAAAGDSTPIRAAGYIVETEAYLGSADPAAHSYRGRTERNSAMFMQPGTCYVYSIYGQYCCVNVSSNGDGCAVLIRALRPCEGEAAMRLRRGGKADLKPHQLCNGPSKLCQALAIDKLRDNKADLCDPSAAVYIESGGPALDAKDIVTSRRIGIDGCGPAAAAMPLRFYCLGCACVSKKDKAAEALIKAAQSAATSKGPIIPEPSSKAPKKLKAVRAQDGSSTPPTKRLRK